MLVTIKLPPDKILDNHLDQTPMVAEYVRKNGYVYTMIMDVARDYAAQWFPQNKIEPEVILKTTCMLMNVSVNDVKSDRSFRELVDARAVFSALCRDFTSLPLAKIGEMIGRNHSSITHYLKNTINIPAVEKHYKEIHARLLTIK